MERYSQNNEETVILEYLQNKNKSSFDCSYITFLDIGANDGRTLSNTHALALKGAKGTVVEPSNKAFSALNKLYEDNPSIFCLNAAIGDVDMITTMYESGTHLHEGDTSLLSTLNKADYDKWKDTTDFKEVDVEVYSVATMLKLSPYNKFDLISIDCEGNDLLVLSQMNLTELGCKCLVIEWNSDKLVKDLILSHCALHGLNKVLLQNNENLVICK